MRLIHMSLLAIAFAFTLAADAFGGQPDWVGGDTAEYPIEQYLVGRGTGATEEEARNRARGDLATVFEVRVQVMNANETTVSSTNKKEQIQRTSTQQVSAKTDKVIQGINIASIWRDPVTQDFHALAVLSRSQAASSLIEELDKIDKELQLELNAAEAATDPLLKVGALTRAMQATIKREGFQATLKIVDPSGHGVPAKISQAAVRKQLDAALKQIRIAPDVIESAGKKEFSALLKSGLASAGFLMTGQSDADLILEGKLVITDIGPKNGWYWMRATVEVTLVEKQSRRVRGNQIWPVKVSAQDAQTASSRILIEVEKVLKQELRAAVITFAGS